MVSRKVEICNTAGIHVRPSGIIIAAIKDFDGSVLVRHDNSEAQITGVMSLIALGLVEGDKVELEVTGANEAEKLEEISELFTRCYDFPPRR